MAVEHEPLVDMNLPNPHRVLLVALLTCAISSPAYALSSNTVEENFVVAADTEFSERVRERLDAGVREGRFNNLHAVVIARGDRIVLEQYYRGPDERWGQPTGTIDFTSETLHDLRSVTKSVVGLLYGIALEERKVPPLDAPLLNHLPQHSDLASDPERARITVADALTMRLGLEWNEDLPYTDPRNSEHAMELAPDRCRFVLEQPLVDEPGARWNYSGGATALLACLLVNGTKMSILDYAREKLFQPLGIDNLEWVTGRDGVEVAASGLRMQPRDLAKIGLLVLNHGAYKGRQLVPAHWLDVSFKAHARIDDDLDYGYHWWIARRWSWVAALGNGGQRLTVFPGTGLVLVVTAGNYNSPDAWRVPVGVLVDAVLPVLEP